LIERVPKEIVVSATITKKNVLIGFTVLAGAVKPSRPNCWPGLYLSDLPATGTLIRTAEGKDGITRHLFEV
jgi:hypothetical protein